MEGLSHALDLAARMDGSRVEPLSRTLMPLWQGQP